MKHHEPTKCDESCLCNYDSLTWTQRKKSQLSIFEHLRAAKKIHLLGVNAPFQAWVQSSIENDLLTGGVPRFTRMICVISHRQSLHGQHRAATNSQGCWTKPFRRRKETLGHNCRTYLSIISCSPKEFLGFGQHVKDCKGQCGESIT